MPNGSVVIAVHSIGTKGGLKPPGSILRVPEDISENKAATLKAGGHIREPEAPAVPESDPMDTPLTDEERAMVQEVFHESEEARSKPDPGQGEGPADYTPPQADQEVVIVGLETGGLPFATEALNLETQDELLPHHQLLLEQDGVRVFISENEGGLDTLKKTALQEIAKAFGLEAGGKRDELLARLRPLLPVDD